MEVENRRFLVAAIHMPDQPAGYGVRHKAKVAPASCRPIGPKQARGGYRNLEDMGVDDVRKAGRGRRSVVIVPDRIDAGAVSITGPRQAIVGPEIAVDDREARRPIALHVGSGDVLEDRLRQRDVQGYRAPSFSIGDGNLWAYDCLARAGYRYSSSVYPIRHDHYGSPAASRFTHVVNTHVLEVPITTARLFRTNWPAGGGGYFRLMPYAVSRWLIRHVNRCDEESAIFYFHPWEIDPEQPRVSGVDAKTRFRHYVNLRCTADRLKLLLQDFRWDRMDRVVFGVA